MTMLDATAAPLGADAALLSSRSALSVVRLSGMIPPSSRFSA